jgi:hypothetical protein
LKEDTQKTAQTVDVDRRGSLMWVHRITDSFKCNGEGTKQREMQYTKECMNNEENPKQRAKVKLSL